MSFKKIFSRKSKEIRSSFFVEHKKRIFSLLLTLFPGIFTGFLLAHNGKIQALQERLALTEVSAIELVRHNSIVALLIIVLGTCSFGVFNYILLFINGLSFGIVLAILSVKQIFCLFLPYALFEVFAFLGYALFSLILVQLIKQKFQKKKIRPAQYTACFHLVSLANVSLALAGILESIL